MEVSPPLTYRFGPFRMDCDRGSLFRGGDEIALTPKAFALLRLFLERPDALHSKQSLLAELWPGTHVEENNLNQQIAALRRAIGDGWIETVPRRGFRFVGGVRAASLEHDPELAPRAEREAGEGVHARRVPGGSWLGLGLVALASMVTVGLVWVAVIAGGSRPSPARAAAPDPRAQEEYLAGRFAWNRRTLADFQVAVAHFRRALTIDPNFAAAWSGLGDSLNLQGLADEGEQAARRALALDDRLAEAHATLGNVQLFRDWNLDAAERSFHRALELDPAYATARQWRAFLYAARGDAEAAVREIERAIELEPLSRILATDGAQFLYLARHYERAEEQVKSTLRLDPHFGQAYNVYADILSATGRPAEALEIQRRAIEFGGHECTVMAERQAKAGLLDDARKLLAACLARPKHHSYGMARVHFALGDRDAGFDWLGKALAERDPNLLIARLDPTFDEVRDDPRWPPDLVRPPKSLG